MIYLRKVTLSLWVIAFNEEPLTFSSTIFSTSKFTRTFLMVANQFTQVIKLCGGPYGKRPAFRS